MKLNFFHKFSFYVVLVCQHQTKGIYPMNCSIFMSIDFPRRIEEENADFEQSAYEPTICRVPLIRDGSAIFNQ
jgi:hypothetical protein